MDVHITPIAGDMDETTRPQRICLFSHPRTACNLLFRLLGSHPSFEAVGPFDFVPAYFIGQDFQSPSSRELVLLASGLSEEEASKISYQASLDAVEHAIREAEIKGKVPLTMEHPYMIMDSSAVNEYLKLSNPIRPSPTIVDRMLDVPSPSAAQGAPSSNPTLLPDRLYYSFTPIIVIRHPARVLPSYVRLAGENLGSALDSDDMPLIASFQCERLVFDSFRDAGITPIVVDGERLVKDPHGQMKKLCNALAIDDGQIKYTWDAVPEGQIVGSLGRITTAFFSRLSQSTGVIPDPRFEIPLKLEDEVLRWAEEWNADVARKLEIYVLGAMEDYEYLLEYSL
ncbi:hypothetical protein VNI00_008559 [Paramarasmius palmivorus]|uniref:Sulfotransferase n=1 Tax=Paramarasmius palmivorus TaxID=297713 RepID=A0AAW0CX09_9AGAR